MVAEKIGLSADKCIVINNGIDPKTLSGNFVRKDLEDFLGENLDDKIVIVRVARYVKHKGVEWFLQNVMPLLPEDVIFVGAGGRVKKNTPGDVDLYPECEKAVKEKGLEHRVKLLTNLPWEKIKLLFHTADIVVSPNIVVPGTMEGFGISVIEAALCGRPVITSNLQGLKDAIIQDENGLLVEPGNALAWSGAITTLLHNEHARHDLGTRAALYTEQHFHWKTISRQYVDALSSASPSSQPAS